MPGARLTREERDHIAAGLAGGLDYAEIARRLGRPTSTVTREVARNRHAAGGYGAAEAHQATLRRRTGRRPVAPADARFAADFDERFAALMVRTGLPRMAARVLTALVTTDTGAQTAGELGARLRVSPASISKAVAYLESLAIVRREPTPGRRERYVIDDDVWLRTWLTSARQHAEWGETAYEGATRYGLSTPTGRRLERMAQFFAQLSNDMTGGLDPAAADDAVTAIAALLRLAGPDPAARLAAALDWPIARAAAAVEQLSRVSGDG